MPTGIDSIRVGRSGTISGLLPETRPRPQGGAKSGNGGFRSPLRRRFTADYKLRVLQQADRAVAEGKGALRSLLAKEGLCSSHLAQWRKLRKGGTLRQATPGRRAASRKAVLAENGRLRRKLAILEAQLQEAVAFAKGFEEKSLPVQARVGWILRQRIQCLADLARPAGGDGR